MIHIKSKKSFAPRMGASNREWKVSMSNPTVSAKPSPALGAAPALAALILLAGAFFISELAYAGGDAAAGATKAKACAGCHGPNGEGVKPNPKLAGKSEDEIAQALRDYKSGKRPHAMMKALSVPLSDADMANLGAFYASKK